MRPVLRTQFTDYGLPCFFLCSSTFGIHNEGTYKPQGGSKDYHGLLALSNETCLRAYVVYTRF